MSLQGSAPSQFALTDLDWLTTNLLDSDWIDVVNINGINGALITFYSYASSFSWFIYVPTILTLGFISTKLFGYSEKIPKLIEKAGVYFKFYDLVLQITQIDQYLIHSFVTFLLPLQSKTP